MAAFLQNKDRASATYTFTSRPRSVPQRTKYRDPFDQTSQGPSTYGNIMYDRRIVRGNTYAQTLLPATGQPDAVEIQKQQDEKRRALAKKRAVQQLKPKAPEPLEGRKHADVQTELYLEELADRIEDAVISTQTDAFVDRPPTPLYMHTKTGTDVGTQIQEDELFDFDLEVRPILEVVVGKTVEQALLEVMEDEELANFRAQQRRFEELRSAELVETQRLEEQERRHRHETETRIRQQLEVIKREKEVTEKIAARAFAQSYLQDLVPSVFGALHAHGYFYDPAEKDIETYFMPWLIGSVERHLRKTRLTRTLLDSIIYDVVTTRDGNYTKLDETIQLRVQSAFQAAATVATRTPVMIVEEGPTPIDDASQDVAAAEHVEDTLSEDGPEQADEDDD